jgi:hypothetical protein
MNSKDVITIVNHGPHHVLRKNGVAQYCIHNTCVRATIVSFQKTHTFVSYVKELKS